MAQNSKQSRCAAVD